MKKINLLYDGVARYLNNIEYDRTWSVAHHLRFLIFANTIVKHNFKNILDVGFGEGLLLRYLNNLKFIGKLTCIDINQKYVKKLQKKYKNNNNISIINTDLFQLNMKFDCIVLGEVIEHIDKNTVPTFLTKCKELLTEDGLVILSTPNKINDINWPDDHMDEFKLSELKSIINNVGFDVIKVYGLWRNTKETLDNFPEYHALIDDNNMYIPQSLLNVFCNLQRPDKSKAVILIFKKKSLRFYE